MQVHIPYMQGMYVTEASNSKEPLHFRENTVTPTSKFTGRTYFWYIHKVNCLHTSYVWEANLQYW